MHLSSLPLLLFQFAGPTLFLPGYPATTFWNLRQSFILATVIWIAAVLLYKHQATRIRATIPFSPIWIGFGLVIGFLIWLTLVQQDSSNTPYLTLTPTENKILVGYVLLSFPFFFTPLPWTKESSSALISLSLLATGAFASTLALGTYWLTLHALPWQSWALSVAGGCLVIQNELRASLPNIDCESALSRVLRPIHASLWGLYPSVLFLLTVLHQLPNPYMVILASLLPASLLLSAIRSSDFKTVQYQRDARAMLLLQVTLTILAKQL
ncbi:MAG: hypothetical protein KDD60_03340 [Bdellovibrionales bacterium]|nr:hypothetical protein [Bdellovibrionales bacterium]